MSTTTEHVGKIGDGDRTFVNLDEGLQALEALKRSIKRKGGEKWEHKLYEAILPRIQHFYVIGKSNSHALYNGCIDLGAKIRVLGDRRFDMFSLSATSEILQVTVPVKEQAQFAADSLKNPEVLSRISEDQRREMIKVLRLAK